jgi:hypothetical protein
VATAVTLSEVPLIMVLAPSAPVFPGALICKGNAGPWLFLFYGGFYCIADPWRCYDNPSRLVGNHMDSVSH